MIMNIYNLSKIFKVSNLSKDIILQHEELHLILHMKVMRFFSFSDQISSIHLYMLNLSIIILELKLFVAFSYLKWMDQRITMGITLEMN